MRRRNLITAGVLLLLALALTAATQDYVLGVLIAIIGGAFALTQPEPLRGLWWLVLGAFFASALSGRPGALAVGGLVLASFALAVAVNFRGLGTAFPGNALVGPFRRVKAMPWVVRTQFGVLAALGAFVCATMTLRVLS
jgi:hypothetical protein